MRIIPQHQGPKHKTVVKRRGGFFSHLLAVLVGALLITNGCTGYALHLFMTGKVQYNFAQAGLPPVVTDIPAKPVKLSRNGGY